MNRDDEKLPGAVDLLFWRDEILQVMYWMEGEGLTRACSFADLKRFLQADVGVLDSAMASLLAHGWVESAEDRFTLTAAGRVEGGRRFADEFEPMLKPGHFECDEPDCECHDPDSIGYCKNLTAPIQSALNN